MEPKKKDHWRELETIGDAYLNVQVHRLHVKMCGKDNFGLVKVLQEHVKSNPFLMQLGKHYKLDEWVHIRPCFFPKQWADLMEAWIGAVVTERTLYDGNDPLEDLNLFLGGLLTIRYRNLEEYFMDDVNFGCPERRWNGGARIQGPSKFQEIHYSNGSPEWNPTSNWIGTLSLIRNQEGFITTHRVWSYCRKSGINGRTDLIYLGLVGAEIENF